MAEALLELSGCKTYFYTDDGVIKAVDDVSFSINPGETLGVVGESGCGKSVTALSIMRLIPEPPGKIVEGEIKFRHNGDILDIAKMDRRSHRLRTIRGNDIAMIFQEPMTSLTPVYTVGEQIMEAIVLHQKVERREARTIAVEMLGKVGIPTPEERVDSYPHELSGGMRQRAMIAMALSCNPKLLIADEPTTALDVTIEAQILHLMRGLQEELGMATMFITHDLGVIGEVSKNVVVMYTGKIVEKGSTKQVFKNAHHPYTQGLLASRPRIGRKRRLIPITGNVPSLLHLPKGCYFAPRCPHVMDVCRKSDPPLLEVEPGHYSKCRLDDPSVAGDGT